MANIINNNLSIRGPKQAFYDAFRRAGLFASDQAINEEAVCEAFSSDDFTLGSILVSDEGNWRSYNVMKWSMWENACIGFHESEDGTARINFNGASKWSSIQPWVANFIGELPEKAEFLAYVYSYGDDYAEDYAWDGMRWISCYDADSDRLDCSYTPLLEAECTALRDAGSGLVVDYEWLVRAVSFFRPKIAVSKIEWVRKQLSGKGATPKAQPLPSMTLHLNGAVLYAWTKADKKQLLNIPVEGEAAWKTCSLHFGALNALKDWLEGKSGKISLFSDGKRFMARSGDSCFSSRVTPVRKPSVPKCPVDYIAQNVMPFIPKDLFRAITEIRRIMDEELDGKSYTDVNYPDVVVENFHCIMAGDHRFYEDGVIKFEDFVDALYTMRNWTVVGCYRLGEDQLCCYANAQQMEEFITLRLTEFNASGELIEFDSQNIMKFFFDGELYLPGIWHWRDGAEDEDNQRVTLVYGYEKGGKILHQTLPLSTWNRLVDLGRTELPVDEQLVLAAETGCTPELLASLPAEEAVEILRSTFDCQPQFFDSAEELDDDRFSELIVSTDDCAGFCRQLIHYWVFAADDEYSSELSNVQFDYSRSSFSAVVTDAHRVHVLTLPNNAQAEGTVLLHKLYAYEVARLLADQQGPLEIWKSVDGCLLFKAGDLRIKRPTEGGRFPNYKGVIPASYEIELTVAKADILKAVAKIDEDVESASDELEYVKLVQMVLTIADGFSIRLENKDFGVEFMAQVDDFTLQKGDRIEIGFNYGWFKEMLSVWPDDELMFHFADPRRAAIISNPSGTILHLIMPRLLDN